MLPPALPVSPSTLTGSPNPFIGLQLMQVLEVHREKTGAMKDALDHMIALHDELYGTWEEIVTLTRSSGEHRIAKIAELHEQAKGLSSRIITMRREVFGQISESASLNLASLVDSASLLYPPTPQKDEGP